MSYLINDSQFSALSGNLQTTGQSLINLINASSAGVSKIYVTGHPIGQSGNINFSGLGGLIVSTGANNFIYFSGGASSSSISYSDGINLSGNLHTTGSTLYTYATNISGNLDTRLYQTGLNARNNAINLSGNLQTTGSNLYNYIINTSGNLNTRLIQTGISLIALIATASAGVSSFNNASGILSLTGTGNITIVSGGVGLIIVSGNTGAYSTFYQNSNPNNYPTSGNLQATGQAAWNAANSNAINLSGNLQTTGSNLQSQINILNSAFETGGTILNGQLLIGTSVLNAYEQGNVYGYSGIVITSGSGSLGVGIDQSIFLTSATLQQSGTLLNNRIISLSGDLYSTGNILNGRIISLSGDVFTTGSVLNTRLVNTSGVLYPLSLNPSGYVMTGNASPAFITSGGSNAITGFTLNIDRAKVVNNFDLTFISGNNNISVNNAYNGCMGVVLINKNFTGVGNVFLPTFSKVVDTGNGSIILPTGSGNHLASFVYTNSSTGWWTYGKFFN